jgi:hypothetical protein
MPDYICDPTEDSRFYFLRFSFFIFKGYVKRIECEIVKCVPKNFFISTSLESLNIEVNRLFIVLLLKPQTHRKLWMCPSSHPSCGYDSCHCPHHQMRLCNALIDTEHWHRLCGQVSSRKPGGCLCVRNNGCHPLTCVKLFADFSCNLVGWGTIKTDCAHLRDHCDKFGIYLIVLTMLASSITTIIINKL